MDTVRPNVVSISSAEAYDTNVSPVPVTVVFDEAVTAFVTADVTVNRATAISVTANTDLTQWVIELTPTAEDVLTASVATEVLTDLAGNLLDTGSNDISFLFDTTQPTVVVSSTVSSLHTDTSPVPFTFTFSEAVAGFTTDDVAIGGGVFDAALTETSTGLVWTGEVVPSSHHVSLSVRVPAHGASDPAGNANVQSNTKIVVFDNVNPLVVGITTDALVSNVSPLVFKAYFSERVVTFDYTGVTATGGTVEDTIALTLDATFTDTDTSLNLTASTPLANSDMGTSVAMAGRFVLAGAPGASSDRGQVEVWAWDDGAWANDQTLTGSGGATGDLFGSAVAISSTWVAVGAPGASSGAGKVFVYKLGAVVLTDVDDVPGTFAQTHVLTDAGSAAFGQAVALGSNMLVVSGKVGR